MQLIPMCWKCASAVMVQVDDKGGKVKPCEMVGCKENPDIKGFDDAPTMCPLTIGEYVVQSDETNEGSVA